MAVNWTENQQRIIDFSGGDILVSAGAGSGKTAVLTEHIVNRITNKENPVDLDTLLVVTFTNAAAAEMKERVRKRLEDLLAENPDDENLSRQIALIPSANICTIDSFCMKLVKEQFFRLDLDPGFRIGDTGELSLMQADIIENIFEKLYSKKDGDFLELRSMYSGKNNDDKLMKLIIRLYDYSQSHEDPIKWLKKSLSDDFTWADDLLVYLKNRVSDARKQMENAVNLAYKGDASEKIKNALETDLDQIPVINDDTKLEELCKELKNFEAERKPIYKGSDNDIKTALKIKSSVKKSIDDLKDKYGKLSDLLLKREDEETLGTRKELVKLVRLFYMCYSAKKRSLGICDFSDVEHMAYNLLYVRDKNGDRPSEIADSYARSFTEILTDEYQDCNLIQDRILDALSTNRFGEENRFMVGDVKQSIYGFRQARPDLFMDKYKSYSDEADARSQKVELADNFRSRSGVLNGINMIFSQIMTGRLGDISYDDKAALKPGAVFTDRGDTNDLELLVLDISDSDTGGDSGEKDDDNQDDEVIDANGYNKYEYEAHMIGEKIIELVNPGNPTEVYDRELDCMRPAEFRDIVILMRSLSSKQENYMRVFRDMGIPAYVQNDSGYFSSAEVVDVLNFLRVLDNPLQDIPLVGVMRSAFGNFSAQELADIKLLGKEQKKDKTFYDCVMAARDGDSKVDAFMTTMENYRRLSRFIPIHELLTRIIEETGYKYYVSALPQGKKRLMNLDMLVAKALDYEETSYRGLFHFIRYIDRLKKYDYELDVAGDDENVDAVRLMTIHKSKGLEFPIVFLSNMSGEFNQADEREAVALDSDCGIACDIKNAKYHYRVKTEKKKAINQKNKLKMLEEEMRLLYVAMTRAKEMLIMTGIKNDKKKDKDKDKGKDKGKDKDKRKDADKWQAIADESDGKLSYSTLVEAKNYLDWVAPAFLYGQNQQLQGELQGVKLLYKKKEKDDFSPSRVFVPELKDSEYGELPEKLKQILTWKYPHEESVGVHAAMSVSEIKKAEMEDEEFVSLIKDVEADQDNKKDSLKGASGADRGTAYHKVLELCSFRNYPSTGGLKEKSSFVDDEMKRIAECHLMPEEDEKLVDAEKIGEFFESPIAGRMCEADKNGRLRKEEPFVMGVPAGYISQDMGEGDETVLIRGIIDAFFEEDGEIVLVDYKTDRVRPEDGAEVLKKRYTVQMKYYKRALENGLGKKVKEIYLYSFALKQAIEISL